jgi:hypothetical protein
VDDRIGVHRPPEHRFLRGRDAQPDRMSTILLTNSAAAAAGVSKHKLAGPKYRRVVLGVHTPVDAELDLVARCDAALLVVPAHAVFSHWTAVALMGGPVMGGPSWLEIIEPSTTRTQRPEVKGRRRVLADQDVVRRGKYLITAPIRTVHRPRRKDAPA